MQVNFQHWQTEKANSSNSVESCAELIPGIPGIPWNNVNCEKYNSWVCQIRAGKLQSFVSMGLKQGIASGAFVISCFIFFISSVFFMCVWVYAI